MEDEKQLDKVWQFKEDLPALKKVVQYSGSATNPEVLGWNDLITLGRGLGDDLTILYYLLYYNYYTSLLYIYKVNRCVGIH